MTQNALKSLTKEAHQKQAEVLELMYHKNLKDISIANLKQASYSKRVLIESKLKCIVDSLSDYGFLGGIFVNGYTNEVVDGWHRCQLWQELGNKKVPAYMLYFQNRQQEIETHIRLNQVHAAFSPEEFGLDFEGINLAELGFTEADLQTPQSDCLKRDPQHIETVKHGYTKFSTSLSITFFERLRAFKNQTKLKDWADVLEILIDYYEGHCYTE